MHPFISSFESLVMKNSEVSVIPYWCRRKYSLTSDLLLNINLNDQAERVREVNPHWTDEDIFQAQFIYKQLTKSSLYVRHICLSLFGSNKDKKFENSGHALQSKVHCFEYHTKKIIKDTKLDNIGYLQNLCFQKSFIECWYQNILKANFRCKKNVNEKKNINILG